MTERDGIYLGALLHDIGKFAWRAQHLRPGDDHEKLGEYFIREHLGRCKALDGFLDVVISAANRHLGKVWRADCIAAMEREEQDSRETRRPLVSIFARVNIGKAELTKDVYYIKPSPLEREMQFPRHIATTSIEQWQPDEEEMIRLHKQSWDRFLKELKHLQPITDFNAFADSLYALLEKYTSTVSSASYLSYPDIPLFDHLRTVAALAICLQDADTTNEECLLIQGDLSGIQNYIYKEIRAKEDVAKRLRGRSLYVSLLCDTIADYIVRELNLYRANLLFSSGGHFLILAPNAQELHKKIDACGAEVNRVLAKTFSNHLQLVLASVGCSATDLMEDFAHVRQNLQLHTEREKRQKSFNVLKELLFDTSPQIDDNIDKQELALGEQMPKNNILIKYTADQVHDATVHFRDFNTYWKLTVADELSATLATDSSIRSAVIYKLDDTEIAPLAHVLQSPRYPMSIGFRFIGRYVPNDDGKIWDFDRIAQEGSKDYPLLGVIRMDVDDLGAIFALGLREATSDEKKYTLSRFAALSRHLTHFFGSHIDALAERYKVYLGYSGGDDLFAVGSWVNALDFAQTVRDAFTKCVCENGNLTLSAGLVFTKPEFPIVRGALAAGAEEENAKHKKPQHKKANQKDEDKKDRISVFDRQVTWKEFRAQINLAKGLYAHITDEENRDRLERSFVHTLLSLTQRSFDKDGRLKPGLFARASYHFARRKAGAKQIASEQREILEMTERELQQHRNELNVLLAKYILSADHEEQHNRWHNFVIPASYVLYKTRKH